MSEIIKAFNEYCEEHDIKTFLATIKKLQDKPNKTENEQGIINFANLIIRLKYKGK